MIVKGRWFWTADRSRLVSDGDPDAAFLAYPSGAQISDEEARRMGLLKVAEPVKPPTPKAVRKPADKMLHAHSDK